MKTQILFLIIAFVLLTGSISAQDNKASVSLTAAIYEEEVTGNLDKAVELYLNILKKYPDDRQVAAKTLYHLGLVNEKMGKQKANEYFTRLVNTYPDQTELVALAKARLAALGAVVNKDDGVLKISKIYESTEKIFGFLSPDGKKLALIDAEGNIWVRQVDNSKEVRLTHTPNFKYWCFWSPDGETIAYLDVLSGLYVVPSKGGEPKPLIAPESDFIKKGNYAQPTGWTMDGQMIICQVSKRGLCAIPISGGEWKDLFKFTDQKQEEEFQEMTLSPNGKFIAYGSKKSGNSDIYVMPTNGGQSIQITNHPASDGGPSWSFDGKWISFLSARSGDREIWVIGISPDGYPQGEPFQVFRGLPRFNCFFNWINDGKIGISMNPIISNVFITDLETGKETQLTNILADERSPRWSPDGRQIAFVSYRDNKPNLWVIPSGGGVAKKVTLNVPNPDGSCYLTRPSWLPDGKSLAFGGFFGKDHGIWIVSSGGGVPQLKKFDFEVGITSCDVSPDGLYIAFDCIGLEEGDSIKGSRTFEKGIYVIPFRGGEPKRMTKTEKSGLNFSFPRWSPDGNRIAFRSANRFDFNEGKESSEIWVCGFPDGEPKPITKKMTGNLTYLSWSPDKKTIIFSMFEKNRSHIYSVPSEGGEVKKMNIEGNAPDFSPDGKKIAYVKDDKRKSKVEYWLIENFLPK
ncbi:MAG: tetratricopeptide repeat protein [Bacteroidales bacterium]